MFGMQDTSLISYMVIFVITILTFTNSLAPKFAAGGDKLKIICFLSIMCLVSGVVLGTVPFVTSRLFSI